MDLSIGATFPALRRTVTQRHVDLYARASADKNPLHLDEEFAKTTFYGRRIAHGQLTLSISAQILTAVTFDRMSTGATVKAAFLGPVFPGDELLVTAKVVAHEETDAGGVAVCELETRVADRQVLAATIQIPLSTASAEGAE